MESNRRSLDIIVDNVLMIAGNYAIRTMEIIVCRKRRLGIYRITMKNYSDNLR